MIINDSGSLGAGTNNNLLLEPDGNGVVVARQGVYIRNAITSQTDELNLLVNASSGAYTSIQSIRNTGSVNTYFQLELSAGISGSTKGQNMILKSGNGFTNSDGGDVYISPGFKNGSGKDGNISFHTTSQSINYQSMQKGIFIANATTAPSGDPTGGGFLYVEGGALKYRGSSGTVSTVAPA